MLFQTFRRAAGAFALLLILAVPYASGQATAPATPAPATRPAARPAAPAGAQAPARPTAQRPAGAAAGQLAPVTGRETTAASVARYALADGMPVDPEVLIGTLPNGLKYYIRPNAKPAKQAEMRLVVKAGSVLEDEDQRGLAHFVEHMQFEGSRHFPGNGINDFLGSLGLSLGSDANAETSFDETSYSLKIPTDVPGVLDTAMTVLEDWAGGATFDQSGIDKQRPIVLAEWRRSLGAEMRTEDQLRRAEVEGSRYADRSPIGVPEVIQSAKREQLVRYYRDWYRPNLMAVIVVGDIDRQTVAAMIRSHFSGLTNPVPERPRPNYDVPEQPETRFAIVTDKEATSTVVRISNLRPARNQGSVGGYRDIMKDQLFAQMLGDRLDEIGARANAPFLRAAAGRALYQAPRTRDAAVVQALVTADGITAGLDALATELQRVARYGFTATELDRAKQASMAGSERTTQESPDRESESRADEYTRNFLQSEALPTIWQELAFHRRFLPEITLREVNALLNDWFPTRNRLVVVSAPEVQGAKLPDRAALAAVLTGVTAKKLDPYTDAGAGQALMAAAPMPGRVVREVVKPGTNVIEWTLSNGATVVLKPTTLKADQILFRAIGPGGSSLANDDDFPSARIADDVIGAGGVGTFSDIVLDKLLAGKAAVVRPFIGELFQGMGGGATPKDLETMFQLIHLRFTQPRADTDAFASINAQTLSMLANQDASPDFAFANALDEAFTQGHPRRMSETPATVARRRLDRAMAFYKARFADAGNFTFVFVGSFTPEAIKPLVETYLASLPATRAKETWRDLNIPLPRGVIKKVVRKGTTPKSEVAILFSGAMDYDDMSRIALRAAVLVLQSRLNDAIREELGGTYSITVDSDTSRFPKPEYRVRIDWTCDPAQVDALVARVFQEVAFVKRTVLRPNQMDLVQDVMLRNLQKQAEENRWVLNEISQRYQDADADNLAALNRQPQQIEALTGALLQQAADKYFDTNNYIQVTLLPEAR